MFIDAFTIAALIVAVFTIAGIVGLCLSAGNGCASGDGPVHSRRPIH
jgi:hypothetical protein